MYRQLEVAGRAQMAVKECVAFFLVWAVKSGVVMWSSHGSGIKFSFLRSAYYCVLAPRIGVLFVPWQESSFLWVSFLDASAH